MGSRFASPARLLALFVLLSGIPLIALGWLGWRVLEQDRALDAQRSRDRLENAAGALTHALERELTAWETLAQHAVDGRTADPPADTALIIFNADGIVEQRGVRLPYQPHLRANPPVAPIVFAEAEAQEFRTGHLVDAAASYKQLADTASPAIRAASLMRLARVLRKQQQLRQALEVYASLAAMGGVTIAGSPSELVARRERVVLLQAIGNRTAAAGEAAQLGATLAEGRYAIDRSTFEFYREAATLPDTSRYSMTANLALADATEALWPDLRKELAGRAEWTGVSGAFISVWRQTGTRGAAVVANLATLTTRVRADTQVLQARWSLEDSTGREIFGRLPVAAVALRKTSRAAAGSPRCCLCSPGTHEQNPHRRGRAKYRHGAGRRPSARGL